MKPRRLPANVSHRFLPETFALTRRFPALELFLSLTPVFAHAAGSDATPLAIGETWTLDSEILGETRTINVYLPPQYVDSDDAALPVFYMPDGGIREDFPHIAGLLQISALNGTMRPMILVGVENTQRRRDLTGPTEVTGDKEIAPVVGGSAAFRAFIREELITEVERRYRTTGERALIGESLAGLFAVETLLLEPDLFDTYIAVDPSLWWNSEWLVQHAGERLAELDADRPKALFLAHSDEPSIAEPTGRLVEFLEAAQPDGLTWVFEELPNEHHWTIFHPAVLHAVRALLAPEESAP